MVLNCFVVSPESTTAEQKLSRIAEDLVLRMRGVNTDTGGQLVELIEAVQKQQRHRFVLLVGNKGAGKSTFVERFFRFIIPREIADGLILIQINVAHSDGDRNKLVEWLNQATLEECEKVLFANEGPSWEEYVGAMFFDEYKRWSEGSMRPLYESDKTQFRVEFGRHIENVRRERPHEFIRRLLRHVVHSRKKVPCLIFDNTDHFTIEFQEAVFQYARSLYESELSLVIVPITDRTSWQLSKQGALQSFESEALFLPVPNPQRVIERRIAYLAQKIQLGKERQSQEYFFGRGIKLDIANLSAFAASLHRIFVHSRSTADWLGGLVNYDIRRLLEQTRDVIASPHLPTEDLLKAHLTGTALAVDEWRIKHAIIKRRYDIYPAGDHPFLQNIFAMTLECVTTPLLGIRILQFLRDAQTRVNDEARSFVPVNAVYEHCNAMGIQGRAVSLWLDVMLKAGLVLEYDPTITEVERLSKVEISSAGMVHLIWGTTDDTYLQAMRDVTPLRDRSVFDEIVFFLRNDYRRNWSRALGAFIDYLLDEDSRYVQVPDHSLYQGQKGVSARLSRVKPNVTPVSQRIYPKYVSRAESRKQS
jgi:GTPase SAR1 family protein